MSRPADQPTSPTAAAPRPQRRARIALGVAVAVILATVVVVAGRGVRTTLTDITDSGVWLANEALGGVVRVDLATGDTTAKVAAGKPGERLQVVRTRTATYVRNIDTGEVTVVDARTQACQKSPGAGCATAMVDPDPADPRSSIVTDGNAVYFLTFASGQVTKRDRAAFGKSVASARLASEISDGVVDRRGQLWTATRPNGRAVALTRDGTTLAIRHRIGVAADDASVVPTIAAGTAFFVERDRGRLIGVTPDGKRRPAVDLGVRGPDLRPAPRNDDGRIRVSSPSTGEVVSVPVPGGEPNRCAVAAAGASLGAPVTGTAGTFVANYTTGEVVMLRRSDEEHGECRPAAQPFTVPGTRFELVPADGDVVVNDPSSARAGRFDRGGQFSTIDKYRNIDRLPDAGGTGASGPQANGSGSGTGSGPGADGPQPTIPPLQPVVPPTTDPFDVPVPTTRPPARPSGGTNPVTRPTTPQRPTPGDTPPGATTPPDPSSGGAADGGPGPGPGDGGGTGPAGPAGPAGGGTPPTTGPGDPTTTTTTTTLPPPRLGRPDVSVDYKQNRVTVTVACENCQGQPVAFASGAYTATDSGTSASASFPATQLVGGFCSPGSTRTAVVDISVDVPGMPQATTSAAVVLSRAQAGFDDPGWRRLRQTPGTTVRARGASGFWRSDGSIRTGENYVETVEGISIKSWVGPSYAERTCESAEQAFSTSTSPGTTPVTLPPIDTGTPPVVLGPDPNLPPVTTAPPPSTAPPTTRPPTPTTAPPTTRPPTTTTRPPTTTAPPTTRPPTTTTRPTTTTTTTISHRPTPRRPA